MEMGNLTLSSLEPLFDKVEEMPKSQRIMAFVGVFVLLIGAFCYFSFLPKLKKIERLEAEFQKLDAELVRVKRNAAKLEIFRQQYKEAEQKFKVVMRKLPEKDEIPSLLESISRSGQDVGLEFELFQPKGESKKDFYAEIPVGIKVIGGYHDVARFFDRVSRLSRIVNIRDIDMKPIGGKENEGALNTSCTAVTYKFLESS